MYVASGVFANEKLVKYISSYIRPNPVTLCRLQEVNKVFRTRFSSDDTWELLDVYSKRHGDGIDIKQTDSCDIYLDFIERLSGNDKRVIRQYWPESEVAERDLPHRNLTDNKYLLLGRYFASSTGSKLVDIDDEDILSCVLRARPRALEFASDNLRKQREMVYEAVLRSGCAMEFMHPSLGFDRKLVLTALKAGCPRGCCDASGKLGHYLKYVDKSLLDDTEIMSSALNLSSDALLHASYHLLNNEEIGEKAVKQDGKLLNMLGDNLKQSRRVVLTAVKQYGLALEWVPHFSIDRFIVYCAVNQNGMALEHAASMWQDNHFTVKIAVENCGRALQFASYRLRNSIGCVRIAVHQDARAIEFVSPALRDNKAFIYEIVQIKGAVFKYISERLMKDSELALLAVQQNGRVIQFLGNRHRANAPIIQAAIQTHPYAITYASRELLSNREFLLESVGINGWIIDQLPGLSEDREMVLKAVETIPECILSSTLRFKQEFMLKAIEVNAMTLKYVSHARRNTKNILRAINFLSAKARTREEDLFLQAIQQDLETEYNMEVYT